MSVQITPAGTSEILAGQLKDMRAGARTAMKQATAVAADEVRHLAPGSIAEHIEERVGGGQGTVTGTVFPSDAFAKYVDEGSGIYVEFHSPIRPKPPRRALRFRDGRVRRSSLGQRPQRFIDRAADTVEPRVEAILDESAVAATRKLSG